MLCPNCKKEVTTRFCPDCGLEINSSVNKEKENRQPKARPPKKTTRPRRKLDMSLIWLIAIIVGSILLLILAIWGAKILFEQYHNGLEWLFYH